MEKENVKSNAEKKRRWIQHDIHRIDDEEIGLMIYELGKESYYDYHQILKFLGNASPDYSASIDSIEMLADRYNVEAEYLEKIIIDYGLFMVNDSEFYEDNVRTCMLHYDDSVVNGKKNAKKRWTNNNDNEPK